MEKASIMVRLVGLPILSVLMSASANLTICKAAQHPWALLLADTPWGALFHDTLPREGLRIAMW